jgi:hypothetical protein
MAARKRRRRSSGRRKSVARRRRSVALVRARPRRRTYRRNPGFSTRGIVGQITQGAVDAAWAVSGKAAVRIVRARIGQEPGTPMAIATELGTGIIGAYALRRFARSANGAKMFLAGAFMAPVESVIKAANVPFISPALGDDGTVPYISGYVAPGEVYPGGGLAGYSAPGEGLYDQAGMMS